MNIVVVHSGTTSAVLRPTLATREWEGYYENASSISDGLTTLGHNVAVVPDGTDLIPALVRLSPDVVWICSGGIQGHDQACHLPANLESLGVPYVGSTPLAAGISDNKTLAKTLVSSAGILTPRGITANVDKPTPAIDFPFPVVVKPNNGLCSCGVTKVDSRKDLVDAVARLQRKYRSSVLIESYIDGLDMSVPVLQRETLVTLPPLKRQFCWDVRQASADWTRPHPASEMLEGPAFIPDLPPATRQLLSDAAISACTALGVRHFARVDFRLNGPRLYFLEINHKPDFTRGSLFARSAAAAGIAYETLLQSVLDVAIRDSNKRATRGDLTSWARRADSAARRRAA